MGDARQTMRELLDHWASLQPNDLSKEICRVIPPELHSWFVNIGNGIATASEPPIAERLTIMLALGYAIGQHVEATWFAQQAETGPFMVLAKGEA